MKKLIVYELNYGRTIVDNCYKGVQYDDKTIVLYCKELNYGLFLYDMDALNEKFNKNLIIEWLD